MIKSDVFGSRFAGRAVGALVAATALTFTLVSAADAQRTRDRDREQEEAAAENRQMSTAVGERVLEANELLDVEDYASVVRILDQVMQQEMTPYERSVVLRLRGNSRYNLDNVTGAIADFSAAIDTGALVTDEVIALRTNLGQLYFLQDNLNEGIRQFELALAAGAELNARLAKTLALAYAQAERFNEGIRYAEIFYRGEPNKAESDYALLQYYYSQLNRPQDELRVVREQLSAFPGSRTSWQNLVALFARLGQEDEAFEANKLMYLNGLFQEENELSRLVQYYSYFNNPYRGASILEREINAGRIERTQRNLEMLANFWRQAAEFDRAIPVLTQLSELMGDGETALRLAEAHYQENNLPAAEAALETALARGGLSDTGQAWELLGNVRFDQDNYTTALQAFREAARFPRSRSASNGWIRFINSQIEGERRRALQREQVLIDECRLTLDAERRQIVLTGAVDEDGRVRFSDIPERCSPYFDLFGQQIREAGMSDEEFEAAQADRAAAQAAGG